MKNFSNKIYLGVMSGTSFDAIDVCAISIENKVSLLNFGSYKFPKRLQTNISNVIQRQQLSINEYFKLNKNIGVSFAKAINKFLAENNIHKDSVAAIGVSGQTLFHQPKGPYPYSIQAGDPKIVANMCEIDVVSDFRNTHIELGGEGAPLVPEFHREIFAEKNIPLLVINIGGITNFTHIDKNGDFVGSDCGPGNALMDIYCQRYLDLPFDKKGSIAKKGLVNSSCLNKMMAHPFFKKGYPKSTGKEIFNIEFIPKQLFKKSPNDVLATLSKLTALNLIRVINSKKFLSKKVIVCGGGIKNEFLIDSIQTQSNIKILSSSSFGFDPQAIEAMAFGWMAKQRVCEIPLIVKNRKGLLGTIFKSM